MSREVGHDIVVVGASAGGLQPLQILLGGLPRDLPASVFIAVHRTADPSSMLSSILGRATTLRVVDAVDGVAIERARWPSGTTTRCARCRASAQDALYSAVRALEENAAVSRRLAERARLRRNNAAARSFTERADASAATIAQLYGEPRERIDDR